MWSTDAKSLCSSQNAKGEVGVNKCEAVSVGSYYINGVEVGTELEYEKS